MDHINTKTKGQGEQLEGIHPQNGPEYATIPNLVLNYQFIQNIG